VKTLYVLRHAKSSWDDSSIDDHDRPLSARGRRAAGLIGEHMEAEGIRPQLVLCSTATRARQTLEAIGDGTGTVEVEADLYLASGKELTDRLREVDGDVASVMVIGHNPGTRDLVLRLASAGTDRERVEAKFPTAALATLEIDGEWSDLAENKARLLSLVLPRELARDRGPR
jgi:phosphohistidine phosphatase